jgi:hypothetical protein
MIEQAEQRKHSLLFRRTKGFTQRLGSQQADSGSGTSIIFASFVPTAGKQPNSTPSASGRPCDPFD